MMQGFIFELKIATYAELFIEEMSQSFMEINCKRSETIEMSECVRAYCELICSNVQLRVIR